MRTCTSWNQPDEHTCPLRYRVRIHLCSRATGQNGARFTHTGHAIPATAGISWCRVGANTPERRRCRSRWVVFFAARQRAVHMGAGILFLVSAVLMWRRKDEETQTGKDAGQAVGFFRAVWLVFGVVFVAEWGDLTQIATAGFAARYRAPFTIFCAATAALWLVTGIAVFIGNRPQSFSIRSSRRRSLQSSSPPLVWPCSLAVCRSNASPATDRALPVSGQHLRSSLRELHRGPQQRHHGHRQRSVCRGSATSCPRPEGKVGIPD